MARRDAVGIHGFDSLLKVIHISRRVQKNFRSAGFRPLFSSSESKRRYQIDKG
jgi:hypothetical protein